MQQCNGRYDWRDACIVGGARQALSFSTQCCPAHHRALAAVCRPPVFQDGVGQCLEANNAVGMLVMSIGGKPAVQQYSNRGTSQCYGLGCTPPVLQGGTHGQQPAFKLLSWRGHGWFVVLLHHISSTVLFLTIVSIVALPAARCCCSLLLLARAPCHFILALGAGMRMQQAVAGAAEVPHGVGAG